MTKVYHVDGEPIEACPICQQVTDTRDGKFRLHTVGFHDQARPCRGSYKTPDEAKAAKKQATGPWARK